MSVLRLLEAVLAAELTVCLALAAATSWIDVRRRRALARIEALRTRWSATIFAAADGQTESSALSTLRADERLEIGRLVGTVALSVQGEARRRLTAFSVSLEEELAWRLHVATPRSARVEAAVLLGLLGGTPAQVALLSFLDDRDGAVAAAAAAALARVGGSHDLEVVASRLDRLSGADGAIVAAALADRGADSRPALQRALATGSRGAVWAAMALGAQGDPASAAALAGMLEGPGRAPDPTVRAAACRALGRLDEPRVQDILALALADRDADVRAAAAESLRDVASSAQFEAVARGLVDPDWWVRYHCADILLSTPGGLAAVERVLGPGLAGLGPARLAAMGGQTGQGGLSRHGGMPPRAS